MGVRKVVIWVAAAVVVLFVVALFVGTMIGGQMPYGYGPGMMGGFRQPFGMRMFGGGILMIVFWVAILGGLAWLVSLLTRHEATPPRKDETPMDILKRRYASGEIDREEFERIKEALGN
jgi:putative membrane protein